VKSSSVLPLRLNGAPSSFWTARNCRIHVKVQLSLEGHSLEGAETGIMAANIAEDTVANPVMQLRIIAFPTPQQGAASRQQLSCRYTARRYISLSL
jgi:hypothetical protein